MRVAGERDLGRLPRPPQEHLLELVDPRRDRAAFAPQVEAQVERDLVVAAPARVQLRPGRARDLGDASFDRGVDVLVGRHEHERAVSELILDAVERGDDHPAFVVGQQTDPGEHLHVRARTGQVVARETPVEGQADGERQELVGRALAEPAVPERTSGRRFVLAHDAPGPWRRDQVSAESPHRRTKPSESWWRNASLGVVGREVVVVQAAGRAPAHRVAPAGLEPEPHLAGDVLLGRVDERARARA